MQIYYKSVGYKLFSCDTSDRNFHFGLLLSGKTQITYKSLRNCLYIGNSAFFFEFQAPESNKSSSFGGEFAFSAIMMSSSFCGFSINEMKSVGVSAYTLEYVVKKGNRS